MEKPFGEPLGATRAAFERDDDEKDESRVPRFRIRIIVSGRILAALGVRALGRGARRRHARRDRSRARGRVDAVATLAVRSDGVRDRNRPTRVVFYSYAARDETKRASTTSDAF